jgi:hypothetical protein
LVRTTRRTASSARPARRHLTRWHDEPRVPTVAGGNAGEGPALTTTVIRLVTCLRDRRQDRVLRLVSGRYVIQCLRDQVWHLVEPIHRPHLPQGRFQLAAKHLRVLHRAVAGLFCGVLRVRQTAALDQVFQLHLRRDLRRLHIGSAPTSGSLSPS